MKRTVERNVLAVYREDLQLFELQKPISLFGVDIHVGFKSDGFSVPWYLRWYVSRVDKGWVAAWFHDYCYVYAIKTKSWADLMFYKILRKCGVRKSKARKMYIAVKFVGKGRYKCRNQSA